MQRIDLNDPRILSASDAANKWSLDDSAIRKRISAFPVGTIRKFGKQWIVTEEGMNHVFGKMIKDR